MKHRSLVTTLVTRLLVIGMFLTLANILLVLAYYASDPDELRREKFDQQIDRLAAAIQRAPSGPMQFQADARLLSPYVDHPGAYAFRIIDGTRNILGEANPQLLPDDRWSGVDGPDAWSSKMIAGSKTIGVGSRLVSVGGENVRITFAASGDPSNLFRFVYYDELFVHVVVSLMPFAAILLTVNAFTVRQSLRSLVRAADVARAAGTSAPIEPLPTHGLPSEVHTLVESINDALRRLQSALEAEKAFTAEAAHALRTPLAVLSARIDGLPDTAQLSPIKSDISALGRLVSQLLSAAQADTLVVDANRHCDLSAVAATVAAGLAPLAIQEGRSLALEACPSVLVRGDCDALAHALRNLIENALRFSPRGTEVLLSVTGDGILSVLDRGPGISDADKRLVTKRFWRRAVAGQAGTGLGLSIVQRIAEAHHTRLEILDRPGGGTRFEIALETVVVERSMGA